MSIPDKLWMTAGLGAFTLSVGFLVGLSSSPVAGVLITGVFGAVAAVIGTAKVLGSRAAEPESRVRVRRRAEPDRSFSYAWIGFTLLTASVLLVAGVFAGSYVRIAQPFSYPVPGVPLPWQGLEEPRSSAAALQWIAVQQELFRLGYTPAQARAVYQLELRAWQTIDSLQQSDPPSADTAESTSRTYGWPISLSGDSAWNSDILEDLRLGKPIDSLPRPINQLLWADPPRRGTTEF